MPYKKKPKPKKCASDGKYYKTDDIRPNQKNDTKGYFGSDKEGHDTRYAKEVYEFTGLPKELLDKEIRIIPSRKAEAEKVHRPKATELHCNTRECTSYVGRKHLYDKWVKGYVKWQGKTTASEFKNSERVNFKALLSSLRKKVHESIAPALSTQTKDLIFCRSKKELTMQERKSLLNDFNKIIKCTNYFTTFEVPLKKAMNDQTKRILQNATPYLKKKRASSKGIEIIKQLHKAILLDLYPYLAEQYIDFSYDNTYPFFYPIAPYAKSEPLKTKNHSSLELMQCYKHPDKIFIIERTLIKGRQHLDLDFWGGNKPCPSCTAPHNHLEMQESYKQVDIRKINNDPFVERLTFVTSISLLKEACEKAKRDENELKWTVNMPPSCGKYLCTTCKTIFLVTLDFKQVFDQLVEKNGLTKVWEKYFVTGKGEGAYK